MRVLFLIRGLVVAIAIAGAVAASGCRGRSRGHAAGDVKGVGFELQGAAHIERGAIVTKPPGREEAFLSFVAGHAPAWVEPCLAETGGQTPVFGFVTNDKGAPGRLMPDVARDARERCLSARAAATQGAVLPEHTGVTVQISLKSPADAR